MKNNFPILGIETSGELCSVAVMLSESSYSEMNISDKHIHSKKLIGMIETIMANCSLEIKDLSHIAVSIGPGSFTGLRIGLTAAKGIGFGANLPIVPVPTFDVLALQISDYTLQGSTFQIVRKASIDDVYFAKYFFDGINISTLEKVNLVHKDELKNKLLDNSQSFGDFIDPFKIKLIFGPNAIHVCRYSYLFGKDLLTFDYDYLEPFYLKKFIAKVKK